MNRASPDKLVVPAAGLLTVVLLLGVAGALLLWLEGSRDQVELTLREAVTPPEQATLDGAPPGGSQPVVDLRGIFAAGDGLPSSERASWPRFRGEHFDNVGRGEVPLAKAWGPQGPPVLWELALGEGHGGAAVRHGRVYLLDYDEERESDLLRCHSLEDGREIWRRWYRTGAKRNHGTSRTVPTVSEDHVLTLGPRCHLVCSDARTGDFRWGLDLAREYGAREPLWLSAQHPLIDGDTAVVAPAGRALMIGLDAATGAVRWETPNPHGWQMSHSSIVPMTLAGRRMYVYAALGGLVGVAADGDEIGGILWEAEAWNHAVVAPSPVELGNDRILVTAGFGAGSAIFRIERQGGGFRAILERSLDRRDFACEQHTPILYRDHLYTVMPKDGGERAGRLVCASRRGEPVYDSETAQRFGLGPFLIAQDRLFVLSEDGTLTMAEASTEAWRPIAQAKVLDGRDAWAPLALAGGRLLLRDSERMVCLDLRETAAESWLEELTVPLEEGEPRALAVGPDGLIHVAVGSERLVLDERGDIVQRHACSGPVTAMAFDGSGTLYLAVDEHLEVLSPDGETQRWASLGEGALPSSVAVGPDAVWVADAGQRVLWRFDLEGRLQQVLGRPAAGSDDPGFVLPSPYLDLAVGSDGLLWVTNPGQLRVERWGPEGRRGFWGAPSLEPQGFAGCCNPVHLALLPDGSLVTSEKGLSRVKVHRADGQLLAVVAGPEDFAPEAPGMDVAVDAEGRIVVADRAQRMVRVFGRRIVGDGG